jgi:hypothetical protein
MPGLFIGKTGLRSQYEELVAADINLTSGKADALLLVTFRRDSRIAFFDNSLDCDVAIWAVHPEGIAEDLNARMLLMEIPKNRVINFDVASMTALTFDAGTKLFASKVAGTTAAGKLRLFAWG